MYLFFIWREYSHDVVLRAWMKTNRLTREQLLTPLENNQDKDIPLCLLQHTAGLIPIIRNSFPNIGFT